MERCWDMRSRRWPCTRQSSHFRPHSSPPFGPPALAFNDRGYECSAQSVNRVEVVLIINLLSRGEKNLESMLIEISEPMRYLTPIYICILS